MKKISICIPCYNEEENVVKAFERVKRITSRLKNYDFEYILVDNGSLDNTGTLIKRIAEKNKDVVGIFLSRNFGPEASGQAGLDIMSGDAYIGVAADLQDPPEMISKFVEKWEGGFNIILGTYTNTVDSIFMTSMRRLFYKLFKSISNIEVPINVTGFGLIDKKVILALKKLPEKYRFNRGLLAWVGFKTTFIPYARKKRLRGTSSYRFFDYLKFSERGIFGFSYLPLDLMIYSGFLLTGISFLFIIIYLFTVMFFGNPIRAQIPIMLAIVFFGGVELLAISIIGKYIQVIVEETKSRPIYIVEETVNLKNNQ